MLLLNVALFFYLFFNSVLVTKLTISENKQTGDDNDVDNGDRNGNDDGDDKGDWSEVTFW